MERYIALKTIVEAGSFTKAAQQLDYTQPALSQSIASLEKEMGLKLLDRSRSGARLSVDGETIYPYILQLLNDSISLNNKVEEIKGLENATIVLSAYTSVSIHWLPDLIQGFKFKYPTVNFQILIGDNERNIDLIKKGLVDFAFIEASSALDIDYIDIRKDVLQLVVAAGDPLANRDVIRLEDLDNVPFIRDDSGRGNDIYRPFMDDVSELNVVYSTENDEAILSMVENGLGASIITPVSLIGGKHDIVAIPTDPPIYRTTSIGFRNIDLMPVAARRFLDYICSVKDQL